MTWEGNDKLGLKLQQNNDMKKLVLPTMKKRILLRLNQHYLLNQVIK